MLSVIFSNGLIDSDAPLCSTPDLPVWMNLDADSFPELDHDLAKLRDRFIPEKSRSRLAVDFDNQNNNHRNNGIQKHAGNGLVSASQRSGSQRKKIDKRQKDTNGSVNHAIKDERSNETGKVNGKSRHSDKRRGEKFLDDVYNEDSQNGFSASKCKSLSKNGQRKKITSNRARAARVQSGFHRRKKHHNPW